MALHYIVVYGWNDDLGDHGIDTSLGSKVIETHLMDFPEKLSEDRVMKLLENVWGPLAKVDIYRE